MQQLIFKLDQNPNGQGLRCDDEGLFLGRDALLQRNDGGNFEALPDIELRSAFDRVPGDDTNIESRIRSVKLVANALNKGDMARALMTAVLMRVPDRRDAARIAIDDNALIKSGFDPNELRDERGRWADDSNNGSSGSAPSGAHRDPRIQLADDAMSDAVNDPVAEAAARAAAAQRDLKPSNSDVKAGGSGEPESLWQTLRSKLPVEAHSLLSAILRARADEGQNDLAAAQAESKTIANTLKSYADYRARPWIGLDGRPVQVFSLPIVSTSAPFFNPGRSFLAPDAPVTRPGRNADWMDPLINLASIGAMAVGPTIRLAGPAAEALDTVELTALSADGAKSSTTLDQLSAAAGRAAAKVGPGSGRFFGTSVHSAFRIEVDALDNSSLFTEQSYLNGIPVEYGTPGSVRLDVVEGSLENPATIYDLKTGNAALTRSRIEQIRSHLPPSANDVPVKEVRP